MSKSNDVIESLSNNGQLLTIVSSKYLFVSAVYFANENT